MDTARDTFVAWKMVEEKAPQSHSCEHHWHSDERSKHHSRSPESECCWGKTIRVSSGSSSLELVGYLLFCARLAASSLSWFSSPAEHRILVHLASSCALCKGFVARPATPASPIGTVERAWHGKQAYVCKSPQHHQLEQIAVLPFVCVVGWGPACMCVCVLKYLVDLRHCFLDWSGQDRVQFEQGLHFKPFL